MNGGAREMAQGDNSDDQKAALVLLTSFPLPLLHGTEWYVEADSERHSPKITRTNSQ
jgi:hypothetical protein